jgi:hypothetical protein
VSVLSTRYHGSVAGSSRQFAVIKNAIYIVVSRLSPLPSTPEVEELRARAEDCRREVDGWSTSPPSPEESDRFMERLFMLHIDVAKLEREEPGT